MTATTGGSLGEIGTYFELHERSNKQLVAKCLCGYHNLEMMNTGGPALDLIEVVEELKGQGIGKRFLQDIEKFFVNIFKDCFTTCAEAKHLGLHITATKVCSEDNHEWFAKQGYEETFGVMNVGGGDDMMKWIFLANN